MKSKPRKSARQYRKSSVLVRTRRGANQALRKCEGEGLGLSIFSFCITKARNGPDGPAFMGIGPGFGPKKARPSGSHLIKDRAFWDRLLISSPPGRNLRLYRVSDRAAGR